MIRFSIFESHRILKAAELPLTFWAARNAALPSLGRALLPQRPKISNIFG
jgi:hypothetical protein